MTSVLVVINKKSIEKFKGCYYKVLTEHYKNDKANWERRTKELIR